MCRWPAVLVCCLVPWPGVAAPGRRLESADYRRLRSVGEVRLSPDGARVAYTVSTNDGPGRPVRQLFAMTLADGRAVRLGGDAAGSSPEWSPDGRLIAFKGTAGGRQGLVVSNADGTGLRFLAETTGTNSPLTFEGRSIAWSPDGKRLAFVSATPGPETALATGDPVVITRYLYKPDAEEGLTRFNDNRRRHIFLVDVAGGPARPLTTGTFEEHSIDFSPDGREIAFVSNREPDPDLFYNPDLFAVRVEGGAIRRLTATESAEYQPRWSPDGRQVAFLGTRRGLTDLETTMEDTHVWVMAVLAALRRNPWIDRERIGVEGGSYGGQLSCWLITQTALFRAAIPLAPITNNLSYNYMTYYNMYEQMEWGVLPHQGNMMDVLWERSALKHVAKVKTPTMLVHGENDNDVPIAESEQFYIALKDVGVETVMVRYPREGHGLAEPGHVVDLMDRSAAWYEKHFSRPR